MNFRFESKGDGPQRTTSHMTKTFCDILSDYLPESRQTKNSNRIRIKSLKETDLRYNPIPMRRQNPTRSRLLLPLQKENCRTQIKERGNNSLNTKNYCSSKVFRSKKTTKRKFLITIVKFSWRSFRILQTKRPTPRH